MGENEESTQGADKPGPFARPLSMLPVAIFLAYFYAFSFEIGVALYFGFPVGWIPVEISIISNLLQEYAFMAGALFIFLQLNFNYWPIRQSSIVVIVLGILVMMSIYSALNIILFGVGFLAMYFGILLSTIGNIVYNRRFRREGEVKRDYIPNAYDHRGELIDGTIAHYIVQRLGFDPLLWGAMFLLIIPFVFCVGGMASAYRQKTFLSYRTDAGTYVVLRSLGNTIISAPYNSTTGIESGKFRVTNPHDVGLVEQITLPSPD